MQGIKSNLPVSFMFTSKSVKDTADIGQAFAKVVEEYFQKNYDQYQDFEKPIKIGVKGAVGQGKSTFVKGAFSGFYNQNADEKPFEPLLGQAIDNVRRFDWDDLSYPYKGGDGQTLQVRSYDRLRGEFAERDIMDRINFGVDDDAEIEAIKLGAFPFAREAAGFDFIEHPMGDDDLDVLVNLSGAGDHKTNCEIIVPEDMAEMPAFEAFLTQIQTLEHEI